MNLAVFLAFGSSLEDLKRHGQDRRFVDYYLKKYLEYFENVYVFSYANETYPLPPRSELIPNRARLPRFLYAFLLPFLHRRLLKNCSAARVMQANGALPAVIAQKLYGPPSLVTYGYNYGAFARLEGHNWRARIFGAFEKLVLPQASGFISPAPKNRKRLLRLGIAPDKIHSVPNGVDTEIFSPAAKTFNPNHIDLLFVGRPEKQKNLEALLEAVSCSIHKDKIYLTFIGRGSQREDLERKATEKQINLKIIESVPYAQLPRYYQSSDIFALVSYAEGHPKVLLEAASCGLPCLVSKELLNENFRDRENALGCDLEPRRMAGKLDELIDDENLRRFLSQNARRLIVENFNIGQLLEKEIKILKNLSNRKKQ